MKVERLCQVVCVSLMMVLLAGCGEKKAAIQLSLAPQSQTTYKVVTGTGKDYSFVQPSINKTKERHSGATMEMVFNQQVQSVDAQGNATAVITVKQLKYTSQDSQGKEIVFDSQSPNSKSDPLMKLIGATYKIKISPKGSVEVLDASQARGIIKEGAEAKVAERLFSDEEIARRHQVMALFDAKGAAKKGDKWSTVQTSPPGMLRPKTFEKVYTLTDVKEVNGQRIATVEMNAVPSSKRAEGTEDKEPAMGFFANMFEEKDNYTGKMIIDLSTGQIDKYNETLKAEWVAAETPEEQKSDKGPDQLTMGFTYLYSIEKVK